MTKLNILTTISAFLLLTLMGHLVGGQISEECEAETEPLLMDPNLAIAQKVIFEDYTASFNDKCSFGFDDVGCSVEFEGDERTYKALCEGQGGQVYKRPAVLKCLLGAVEYDLGYIPTCVGSSCNITNVRPIHVRTEQVETFLDNLTFTGCEADASGATALGDFSFMGPVLIGIVGIIPMSTMLIEFF